MIDSARTVTWFGSIDTQNAAKVVTDIMKFYAEDPKREIFLFIHSGGGATGTSLGFHDYIQALGINLTTIGIGYVDSAAVVVFLSGHRRLISPHSTLILHQGRRVWESNRTTTTCDMQTTVAESELSDKYYADVVAQRCNNMLPRDILNDMILKGKVLTAEETIRFGIAHELFQQPQI
jgi:ATP-dependent protease ClpP protease subunit